MSRKAVRVLRGENKRQGWFKLARGEPVISTRLVREMTESAKQQIVYNDLDDCINFIEQHRDEIREGRYNLHLEKDWAKALSADDLVVLARNCPASRLAIASATKSTELLETLASDTSAEVREAVADNPRTTANALDALASDSIPAVRMAAASNANISIASLRILATDSINYVRWSVAHNERTPTELLEILIKDTDRHISDEAKKNPNAPKRGFLARLFKR